MTAGAEIAWIGVEYEAAGGAAMLRAWAVSPVGHVVDQRGDSPATPDLATAIEDLVAPWSSRATAPPIICTGLMDLLPQETFAAVPTKPADLAPVARPSRNPDRPSIHVLPPLVQRQPPGLLGADAARIAGLLAEDAAFDGVMCCAGWTTSWAQISAEEVVSFQSFLTGRLLEFLAPPSGAERIGPEEKPALLDAIQDSLSRPEQLARHLSQVEADATLSPVAPAIARARLAGHLIGAELAAARPYWLGQVVALTGQNHLVPLYELALTAQGVPVRLLDDTDLTLAGLKLARQTLPDLA